MPFEGTTLKKTRLQHVENLPFPDGRFKLHVAIDVELYDVEAILQALKHGAKVRFLVPFNPAMTGGRRHWCILTSAGGTEPGDPSSGWSFSAPRGITTVFLEDGVVCFEVQLLVGAPPGMTLTRDHFEPLVPNSACFAARPPYDDTPTLLAADLDRCVPVEGNGGRPVVPYDFKPLVPNKTATKTTTKRPPARPHAAGEETTVAAETRGRKRAREAAAADKSGSRRSLRCR